MTAHAPPISIERQEVLSLAMELAQSMMVPGPRRNRQRAAALQARMAGYGKLHL